MRFYHALESVEHKARIEGAACRLGVELYRYSGHIVVAHALAGAVVYV